MKPKEIKPEHIYRIIDRKTGESAHSYSVACGEEYDFCSVYAARIARIDGMVWDKEQYAIAKYKVTYKLLDEDCEDEE